MAVTVTYDVSDIEKNDRTRIRCAFERFGWEHIGGSTFRYPRFEHDMEFEDWLNHVAPALHFFRSFVLAKSITIRAFTLDAQSSSCFKESVAGIGPAGGEVLPLIQPTNTQLGEQSVRDWVQAGIDRIL